MIEFIMNYIIAPTAFIALLGLAAMFWVFLGMFIVGLVTAARESKKDEVDN